MWLYRFVAAQVLACDSHHIVSILPLVSAVQSSSIIRFHSFHYSHSGNYLLFVLIDYSIHVSAQTIRCTQSFRSFVRVTPFHVLEPFDLCFGCKYLQDSNHLIHDADETTSSTRIIRTISYTTPSDHNGILDQALHPSFVKANDYSFPCSRSSFVKAKHYLYPYSLGVWIYSVCVLKCGSGSFSSRNFVFISRCLCAVVSFHKMLLLPMSSFFSRVLRYRLCRRSSQR